MRNFMVVLVPPGYEIPQDVSDAIAARDIDFVVECPNIGLRGSLEYLHGMPLPHFCIGNWTIGVGGIIDWLKWHVPEKEAAPHA